MTQIVFQRICRLYDELMTKIWTVFQSTWNTQLLWWINGIHRNDVLICFIVYNIYNKSIVLIAMEYVTNMKNKWQKFWCFFKVHETINKG